MFDNRIYASASLKSNFQTQGTLLGKIQSAHLAHNAHRAMLVIYTAAMLSRYSVCDTQHISTYKLDDKNENVSITLLILNL